MQKTAPLLVVRISNIATRLRDDGILNNNYHEFTSQHDDKGISKIDHRLLKPRERIQWHIFDAAWQISHFCADMSKG